MIIGKYNHTIYKDQELYNNYVLSLFNSKLSNAIFINNSDVLNYQGSKNIVDLIEKLYSSKLFDDLNQDEIQEIKQMNVAVRFQGSMKELKQNHRLNIFLNKINMMNNDVTATNPKLSENKINEIINYIKPGYGKNIFKAKKKESLFDEKGIRIENKLDSIIIGVDSEPMMSGLETLMKEVGFGLKEMSEYVFLHELSHAIQHLKVNHEPLLSIGNQDDELVGTNTKWVTDFKYLGSASYSKNIPYSVLAETYADVRAVLMYAQISPVKAAKMLDVIIKWRSDIGKDYLHDTHQGLLKLKDVLSSLTLVNLSADDIHQISRDIASLNGLANVELLLRKETESELDDFYCVEFNSRFNLLKNVGIFSDSFTKNDYMNEIASFKKQIISRLGINNKETINYVGTEKNKKNDKLYIRDRNGLIIRDSMIKLEELKYSHSSKKLLDKATQIKELESYHVDENSWGIMNGEVLQSWHFKEVAFKIKEQLKKYDVNSVGLNKIIESVSLVYPTFAQKEAVEGVGYMFKNIQELNVDEISNLIDNYYESVNKNVKIKPILDLSADNVKSKFKKIGDVNNNIQKVDFSISK